MPYARPYSRMTQFLDALVARGDEEAIAARVRAHLDAGADHVCVYVFGDGDEALPLAAWRRLAPALTTLTPASPHAQPDSCSLSSDQLGGGASAAPAG